jgi:hypothetical protein
MTTCVPVKSFRCWQYRKGEPVPDWAQAYLHERWDDDVWLIEYHFGAWWYTPAEFAERFSVEGKPSYAELGFFSELIEAHTTPILRRLAECEAALYEHSEGNDKYFLRWPRISDSVRVEEGK